MNLYETVNGWEIQREFLKQWHKRKQNRTKQVVCLMVVAATMVGSSSRRLVRAMNLNSNLFDWEEDDDIFLELEHQNVVLYLSVSRLLYFSNVRKAFRRLVPTTIRVEDHRTWRRKNLNNPIRFFWCRPLWLKWCKTSSEKDTERNPITPRRTFIRPHMANNNSNNSNTHTHTRRDDVFLGFGTTLSIQSQIYATVQSSSTTGWLLNTIQLPLLSTIIYCSSPLTMQFIFVHCY